MRALIFVAACATATRAADVARTPPMGWNSWNYWNVGVNATILIDTGKALVQSGLAAAGYTYVNSDDAWMLAQRDANGFQVANPDKFPDGFQAVASYLHSIGLKSGLYTAKGPTTCAGFAASCDHEFQDASQWASWGIDYVKDDSCSTCPNRTDNDDYHQMWLAIQASGRPMVLSVEGSPDIHLLSAGGYGNLHRVGHDISPNWMSMVSLCDIGSGLWPFAHGSLNATFSGYFNDLDMLETGNAPDFQCDADADALARCQAHFTMWTIMKAPLILGNDMYTLDPVTLSVVGNKEAIAVDQDPLAVQGKRVAVYQPKNTSIDTDHLDYDNILVVAPCDSTRPTQSWRWTNATSSVRNLLYTTGCNAADPYQQWAFVGTPGQTVLKNAGSGLCLDSSASDVQPAKLVTCNPSTASQQWTLQPSGHIATAAGICLDVDDFNGPDVDYFPCKQAGAQDSNQVFTALAGGLLQSQSTGLPQNTCLVVNGGPAGGSLSTTDAAGNTFCMTNRFGAEGGFGGEPCSSTPPVYNPVPQPGQPSSGRANYTLQGSAGSPAYNNQFGASGPWPHTRFIHGYSFEGMGSVWTLDLAAAQTPAGTSIQAADTLNIIDDPLVGNATTGGQFCLDLLTGGMLEVWAGPLAAGKIAVALFNRSPGPDSITAQWADIGAAAGASYAVRDIWAAADRGTFTGSYTANVPARSTVYLVLTPA